MNPIPRKELARSEAEKRKKEKKKKKGFKETVNEKLNGNASGSDSQAAKAQVNVVKYSKPSNENVNSPDWRKKHPKKMLVVVSAEIPSTSLKQCEYGLVATRPR
jgi:hypothetical protein